MQVQMPDYFKEVYPNFDDRVRQAVARFIDHIENYDLHGLKGRNKSFADLTDTSKKKHSASQIRPKILFMALSFGHSQLC